MLNVKSRRDRVQGKSKLRLFLEMKDAVERVLASGPASFSRASAGCEYWRRPAVNVGTDVSRHRKGFLTECQDTNVLCKNTGKRQEDIDLHWNGMDDGCLRAFFLNGDCTDEMGNADGTPTNVTYVDVGDVYGLSGFGKAAEFAQSDSRVSCGSAADIDNLQTFSVSFWLYVKDGAAGSYICGKRNGSVGWYAYVYGESTVDGYDVFTIRVVMYCATTHAVTATFAHHRPLRNQWHHVVITYDQTGDQYIDVFIDGEENSYSSRTQGQGARTDDSSYNLTLGNHPTANNLNLKGYLSDVRIYNRILSLTEIERLAHEDFNTASTARVSFTFDDGYSNVYTNAKPVFDAQGEVATTFVVSDWIGGSYMTASQLQALQAGGWEIGSHTKTHANLPTLTDAEVEAELSESKSALEALGLNVTTFAYPYGADEWRERRLCRKYYRAARDAQTGNAGLGQKYQTYDIMSCEGDDETLATLQGWVDAAETGNYWLVLHFHSIDATKATKIDNLIDYIQGKGIPIVTFDAGFRANENTERMWHSDDVALYEDHGAIRLENANGPTGSVRQFYQVGTLTAEAYIVSFLAYTDGSAVTSADVVPFADTAFTNEISEFHYEHLGGGVYFCWGEFAATAADWNVGAEVKGTKIVYTSLFSCVSAGTTMASGPYPRSPIANETTAPKARQADSLTVGGSKNFRPSSGTLDIEFYPLFPSSLSSSFQLYFAHLYGGDGQIVLYRNEADKIVFRIEANGDDDSVIGTISWNRGDRVRVRVVWDCDEKLDGMNYMLVYGRVNDGAWNQIGASSAQPTAPSSDQTLYVGRGGDSAGYEANSFVSWLRIYDRPLLDPSW